MDYYSLIKLRSTHPAWRLLAAEHAPLVVGFLHKNFIEPNIRNFSESALASRLEDYLYPLRDAQTGLFPKSAEAYLGDWADDKRGWLRKYYPADSDEVHFDLTPAVEKAVEWLEGLRRKQFVGTESRLMTIFALLRQMVEGTEASPETRIAELEKKRAQIDADILRLREGQVDLMEETQIKDRFQQMANTARGLLSDFREVEQNFRELDRQVRERIALWEGSKGELLEEVFGEREAIADSDQGKSFRAFWDFLMSPSRQEELSKLLEMVFDLPAVRQLEPDRRLARVHYDWLEAGEVAQRTVARLSEQLRRYLDDKAWMENRRIMNLLREIEQNALAVRGNAPAETIMELDEAAPSLELPMERTLYSSPVKPLILERVTAEGQATFDIDALFDHEYVDKERLRMAIRRCLETRSQATLGEIVAIHPLEQGLAEIVAYLTLATEEQVAIMDESRPETLLWTDGEGIKRQVTLPLVLFSR